MNPSDHPAPSCGCRLLTIHDAVQDAAVPLALLYPALGVERAEHFGPYSLEVAGDAPPAAGRHPLVVISHGNSGTPWAYRELARHLARSGFVVALPAHTGNSRHDNSLAGTVANLENRPRHISLSIDAALADAVLGAHVDAARIAVIGHSIGAYTALAVAGGQPWSGPRERRAGRSPHSTASTAPTTSPPPAASATPASPASPAPVPVKADARVRALVLLNPATFWFVEGSLRQVRLPILMRSGGQDQVTPAEHARKVLDGVADPALVEHQEVAGAGHFAFMSKFPPELTRPNFPPSQDPPGFDRLAIQPRLFADITEFLARTLCAAEAARPLY